ncbi:hypothetical protein ACK3TF_003252 [Chlorella vulgaris]
MGSEDDYARRCRRQPPLTRRQRLVVSCVAAALGLLTAWLLQSGGRRPTAAAAASSNRSAAEQAKAGHKILDVIAKAAAASAEASRQAAAAAKAEAVAAASAASQQQQAIAAKGKPADQLVLGQQKPQQLQQSSQLPGMEDEGAWFDKLSSEGCARAEQLRVCSHRGRLAVEGVPPGSLSAYPVLHKGGVSCYDIDFVQTRDGQLLASHPQEVQAEVQAGGKAAGKGPPDLGQWSLAELRAAGVDDERFPTADALIKASVDQLRASELTQTALHPLTAAPQVFAALLEQSGLLWKAVQGQPLPNYEELPVLLMDLKAEAFNADTINSLTLVANQTRWGGPLIRGFGDLQDPNPPLSPEAVQPFTLLGPSIKMADSFFAAATQLGKPVLAWTVDSPGDLHRALEANLNAVISNCPLAIRGVLLDWRDRCSERQSRLKRERRALLWAGSAREGGGQRQQQERQKAQRTQQQALGSGSR